MRLTAKEYRAMLDKDGMNAKLPEKITAEEYREYKEIGRLPASARNLPVLTKEDEERVKKQKESLKNKPQTKRKHKYNAQKTEVDGIMFDSKFEARRYRELLFMQDAKEIWDLSLQPKFEIIPKQRYKGKTLYKSSYIADFQYKTKDENGNTITVIEDTKGFKTPDYILKKKLFILHYGDKYDFREVRQ